MILTQTTNTVRERLAITPAIRLWGLFYLLAWWLLVFFFEVQSPFLLGLLSLLSIGSGLIGYRLLPPAERAPVSVIGFMSLILIVFFSGRSLYLTIFPDVPVDAIGLNMRYDTAVFARALAIGMIALSGLQFGYNWQYHRRKQQQNGAPAPLRWHSFIGRAYLLPSGLLLLGAYGMWMLVNFFASGFLNPSWIFITDDLSALSSSIPALLLSYILSALRWWLVVNCLLAAEERPEWRWGYYLIIVGVLTPLIISAVLLTSKSGLVWLIVQFCAMLLVLKKLPDTKRLLLLAGLGFLLLYIAFPVQNTARVENIIYYNATGVELPFEEKVRVFLNSFSTVGSLPAIDIIDRISSRASLIEATSVIVYKFDWIEPFLGRETLELSAVAFVPRFLWPEKPVVTRGLWFNQVIMERSSLSNDPPGIPGTLYMSGGVWLVVVGSIIWGFALARVVQFFAPPEHQTASSDGTRPALHFGTILLVAHFTNLTNFATDLNLIPVNLFALIAVSLLLNRGLSLLLSAENESPALQLPTAVETI